MKRLSIVDVGLGIATDFAFHDNFVSGHVEENATGWLSAKGTVHARFYSDRL